MRVFFALPAASPASLNQSTVPATHLSVHDPSAGQGGTSQLQFAAAGFGLFLFAFFGVSPAMRFLRYWPLVVVLAVVGLVCSSGVRRPGEPCTCRQLVADPGHWKGRHVLLDVRGCQRGGDASTLVFRERSRGPVLVVVRLVTPVLGELPPRVDATVETGSLPVLVVGGRGVW